MFILVYCADFNHDDTYHDVLLSMCGKRAQQISAISILLTCYGINITFLVIIGDQYDRIFNSLLADYLDVYWFLDRKFTISITAILFIWPMCYAKRLDFLKHASILGMFAMLYVTFLTIYEYCKLDEGTIVAVNHLVSVGSEAPSARVLNITEAPVVSTASITENTFRLFESLAIIPVLCFAYQTHEVIVPVYACMKRRHIGHFMRASIFGLVILFFLYNLVGAYGYLTFGENVGPDIMSLYDAKDPIVVVGIVALVIKFITTYPPLMFCGRGALDGLYGELRQLTTDEFKRNEPTRRAIITTFWFLSTVALAVFAPDISITLKLLGSMAAINVFIFPGMCLVSLTRRLRRARLAMLTDKTPSDGQQRAKDYYLISGSYFGAMADKQHAQLLAANNNQFAMDNHPISGGSRRSYYLPHEQQHQQQFSTTFASLLDFESTTSGRFAEHGITNGTSTKKQKMSGYGTQMRHQLRQEEFERLITSGSISGSQGPVGRPINDSYDDYSDCDDRTSEKCDMISSSFVTNSTTTPTINTNNANRGAPSGAAQVYRRDSDFNNKDNDDDDVTSAMFNLQNNYHNQYQQPQRSQATTSQCLESSWNNRSTTGSILDRLGSSIAPSTVAQIGISKCAATGLYLFSAMLITFGAFIFVLELVSVFGFQ